MSAGPTILAMSGGDSQRRMLQDLGYSVERKRNRSVNIRPYTKHFKKSTLYMNWLLLLHAYSCRVVSYTAFGFPASFLFSCLLDKIHRLSSLEILAVEIPIHPTRRPARQRDRTDHSLSVTSLV